MSQLITNIRRFVSHSTPLCVKELMYRHLGGGNSVVNKGMLRTKISIIGRHNTILWGKGSKVKKSQYGKIEVRGNNNTLEIGENCSFGRNCVFFLVGNNTSIKIGANTTFTRDVEINVQESGMTIEIGEDCMFSNNIIVRTSDSHPYFDENNKRLNNPKSVKIGNHVWIAPNTKVMKGAEIGDGAIIGSDTTVSHAMPENALCVGRPAKVIKTNVHWTRDPLP